MTSDEKDIEFNYSPLERAAKDRALKAVNKIEDCHPCDALWLEHHIELAFLAGGDWAIKDWESRVKAGEVIVSVEQYLKLYSPEAPKEEG